MSNRVYRLLFGVTLLLSLYFDLYSVLYALIGLSLFEGITNLRVPCVVSRVRNRECNPFEGSLGIAFKAHTRFEAERGLRILVAAFMGLSLIIMPDTLWFFPWFMGFAITGAGISGVCPMFLALKWAGLR